MMNEDNKTGFEIITFAEAPQPVFKENNNKGYTTFGADNRYPEYLLDLFNKSPKHGAIIQGKAGYVCGKGWKVADDDAYAQQFIDRVNPKESLFDVTKKCELDLEIYNGFYLQVNWSVLGGRIAEIFHIDYCNIRTNKDNTQFWYKDSWEGAYNYKKEATIYAAFDTNNPTGTQILYVRNYRPNAKAYSVPEYLPAINYIQSDVEISKHILGNAKGGFSSSKQVTFVNGEPPTEEGKKTITRKVKENFTGSEGSKIIVEFVKNKDAATVINDLGQSDLTKEDFTQVNNLIQQEIFAGHRITSPMLFGIKTEGQLGGRSELRDAYEIFNNTFVNERQMQLEGTFNYLAQINGATEKITIIPNDPLNVDWSDPNILALLPKEYVYEKLGIDTTKYNLPTDAATAATTNVATASNDNIKNLTGRQHQNIDRIIRKVNQGKITKEAATMLLKSGYGLTDEEVNTLLVQQSNFSDDDITAVFAEFGEDENNYIVLKSQKVKFDEVEEEIDRIEFAEELSKVELDIIGLLSKNPTATNEDIAKVLKLDLKQVENVVASLVDNGTLKQSVNGKGVLITEPTQPLSELTDTKPKTTSLRMMYAYDWRNEIPVSERNTAAHPSRDFCVKMMSMKKLYSRTDIESISSRLGYSVFDRVGGFWNNDGEIEYHCRHTWGARLVVKKQGGK